GFLSLQRWPLKGWELPLTGLLLIGGLAATVSTLQAAAPRQQIKAANFLGETPSSETTAQQQQERVVDSLALLPSLEGAAPQQQNRADSSVVASSGQTTKQERTVSSIGEVPSAEATAQPQEQAIDSSTVAPTAKTAQEQQATAADSVEVNPSAEAAQQPQEQATDAPVAVKPSTKWNRKAQTAHKAIIAQVPNLDASLADGTYLYGQSEQPGQIGKEYLVFEARQGKVVGAMYMPGSEFACFHGTLNAKQMNLTVANPYDQSAFSHTIAREQPARIAAAGGQINLENTFDSMSYPFSVGLDGYQAIAQVSDKDQQILNTCLSNYQTIGWKH
ncbi:MAG TPA: hypothetical protein V6C91_08185, partial [Coleofasciculaceae cyanobacterium]